MMLAANKLIGFDKIAGISPLNPRARDAEDSEIEALAASILATGGPVQRPVLREIDGMFEVLVGRRRYLAMQRLHRDGKWPAAAECDVITCTDAEAIERTLAEQVHRRPLHPVAEHRTFAELAAKGFDEQAIARDFGYTVRRVKQSLALGKLAPKILDAWFDGSLTREAAEAYATSADQAEQIALFDGAPELRRNPHEIKRRLRGDAVRATWGPAAFVGERAYIEAGGRTDRDLFSEEDDEIWFLDGKLLRDLAEKKALVIAERIAKAEGWGWGRVEPIVGNGSAFFASFEDRPVYTDPELKRRDEIEAEITALDVHGDDEENARELSKLSEELEQIEARAHARGIAGPRRKKLGVVVTIDGAGELTIDRAMMTRAQRDEERRKSDPEAESDDSDDASEIEPRKPSPIEEAIEAATPRNDFFARWFEAALADVTRVRPDLAFIFALAEMTLNYEFNLADGAVRSELLKGLPEAGRRRGAEGVLEALAAAPLADLAAAFAESVSLKVDISPDRLSRATYMLAAAAKRGGAIGEALSRHFDADAWCRSLSADEARGLVAELDEGQAAQARKLSKQGARDRAAELVKEKGWLPPKFAEIYASSATDPAAEKQVDWVDQLARAEDADTPIDASQADPDSFADGSEDDEISEDASEFDDDDAALREDVDRFLTASANRGDDLRERASYLLDAFNAWAVARGGDPVNRNDFAAALRANGFQSHRIKTGVHYLGLALREKGAGAELTKGSER